MRITEATEATALCLDHDIPAFWWGEPGIGKSEGLAALGKARGADVYDIRLSGFDSVDLRGLPAMHEGKTIWLRPGIWPEEGDGREIIILFDEMDRAAPAVLSAALQIVLDNRIGEHKLPARCRRLAAGNGATDRVGTNRMPDALLKRFTHFDIEPDLEAWLAWAVRSGISPLMVAFMRMRGHELLCAKASAGDRVGPTPRGWEKVNRVAGAAPASRAAIAAGTVGKAAGLEFEGFCRLFSELPPLEAVLRDPHGADVSARPAVQCAITSALARVATRATIGAAMAYVQRLPVEWEIAFMTDATRRDATLKETAAYVQWAARNAEVTL